MARTYVVTGDPRYKQYYHHILDIRDGKQPRPKTYPYSSWDLMLKDGPVSSVENGAAIPLLQLMHEAGFTAEEFGKLADAKAKSDGLTALELKAMRLAESGPQAQTDRARVLQMLHDAHYHEAKAGIMAPINEFFVLMDRRTLDTVRRAQQIALLLRILYIVTTLMATLMLWRAYLKLRATLGAAVGDVHAQIVRIGRGDFSTTCRVAPGMENSVLAGLLEMQKKLQRYEVERQQSEAFKQTILNSVAAEICVLDRDGWILAVNEPWQRFALENAPESGIPAQGAGIGANYLAACQATQGVAALDAQRAYAGIRAVLERQMPSFRHEYACHSPQQQRWFSMIVTPLIDESLGGVVVTHTNITERKLAELKFSEALAETLRLREALDNVPAYIYMKDPQSRYVYASRPTLELFGCSAAELVGCDDTRFFPPDTVKRLRDIDARVFRGEQTDEEVVVALDSGGQRIYWELKTPIYVDAEKTSIWGLLGVSIDITERKQMEEQIRTLAYFDALTSLPNRRMLLDRLAHALSQARRYQRALAIMFLDLDNFKKINDTLGHDIGDELLKEVAIRLNGCVRTGDTVARQGGDEFIIVLAEITQPNDAAQVADKIINALKVPVCIGDHTLEVSMSIGIAVYPINGNDDAVELMKKADLAMYAAKVAGRNGYRFFAE